MKPEIKFTSYADHNFRNLSQEVRAFLYKDYSIEAHNHDFYEMNVVLKGEGTHVIENSPIRVRTGDVFVIPPNTVHAYYDTRELDVFHILLRPSFIAENFAEASKAPGFLQLTEIEPFLRKNAMSHCFLHLSATKLSQLKEDLFLLEDGSFFDDDKFSAAKKHAAWKMLFWLSYHLYCQMSSERDKLANKYESNIISALEYIHKHYGEKITVDILCKEVFLSRSTFLRNFSSICACSPLSYLNGYRVKKAVEMMENADLTKTEIAHACGFYDLSHMERMMRKNDEKSRNDLEIRQNL